MVESALSLSSDDLQGDSQAVVDSLVQMQRKILHALRHIKSDQITNVNIDKLVDDSENILAWIIKSNTAPTDTRYLWWDESEITESET